MDERNQTESNSIDRGEYLDQAISSLDNKYTSGFWTWAKTERPTEYEIIKHKQGEMEHECTSGTNDTFRLATKRWWLLTARTLNEYLKDQKAQEKYGSCI